MDLSIALFSELFRRAWLHTGVALFLAEFDGYTSFLLTNHESGPARITLTFDTE